MNKQICEDVLIVEDDDLIRETIREMLELEGFKTSVAKNGQDALDILKMIPRPCLILLDLMMPVMNGWEFLKARGMNDILATIPVIIVSAAGDDKLKGLPADGIIKKPIDIDVLVRFVKRYCENGDEPAKDAGAA